MSDEAELKKIARENWEKAVIVRQRVMGQLHQVPAGQKTKARRAAQDNYDAAQAAYLDSLDLSFAAADAEWAALLAEAKETKATIEKDLEEARTTVETIKAATKLTGSVTKLIEKAKELTGGG